MKVEGFLLLLLVCFFYSCSTPIEKNIIAIQPFGICRGDHIKIVKQTLSNHYEKEVIVLNKINLPASALINIKTPRYRADSLIRFLKRTKADSIDIVLGLTSKDISTTKRDEKGAIKKPSSRYQDWGIFGLGFRPGSSCIVSTHRLKAKNSEKLIDRLKKVCVHEIGHNLGLKHCPDKKCVMTDACESIKTVDNVKLALCTKCKSKIN